ncbi:hypothetical protein [Streptomyces sp. NPDC001536]
MGNALALLRGEDGGRCQGPTTKVRLVAKGTADTAPLYGDPEID